MRRLVFLVSAVTLVDTLFFSVLAPLLPHYAHTLDLSKSSSGVLTGAFTAGTLLASVPAGLMASRLGVKPTLLMGLAVMSATTFIFGLAGSVWVLDAARFGQGMSSALSWTGGLAWLVAAHPDRRGETIGIVLAATLGGALLGPLLGATAVDLGTGTTFGAVALLGVVLATWAGLTASCGTTERQPLRSLFGAAREEAVATGLLLITLASLFLGLQSVLAPLRLDRLGFGPFGIGVTFLIAAALQGAFNPLLGRWSDRYGHLRSVRAALIPAAILSVAIPWVGEVWWLAALIVAANVAYGVLWVPGIALVADGAERIGLHPGLGMALMNFAWAPGHAVGSVGGGTLAQVTGDGVPYLLLAAACLSVLFLSPSLARPLKRALRDRVLEPPSSDDG